MTSTNKQISETELKHDYGFRIISLQELIRDKYPKLAYHCVNHGLDVWHAVRQYALLSDIKYEEKLALETAALLHDIIVVSGANDNEEKSAAFARSYLPTLEYTTREIQTVERLILATKMPQKPSGLLEGLICDADLDNLGRPDFFELGEKIKKELGIPETPSNITWLHIQYDFLVNHRYHTEVARKLRDAGKERNIRKLERMMKEAEEKC